MGGVQVQIAVCGVQARSHLVSWVVTITYDSLARGETTKREIEPIGLVRYANVWLVPAYCRLRQDLRVFRADQIVEAKLTGEEFKPRPSLSFKTISKDAKRRSAFPHPKPPDRPLSLRLCIIPPDIINRDDKHQFRKPVDESIKYVLL